MHTYITWINQNFIIRITNHKSNYSFLCGAGQLSKHIPEKDVLRYFEEVFHSCEYKPTFKRRNSFKIEFCPK